MKKTRLAAKFEKTRNWIFCSFIHKCDGFRFNSKARSNAFKIKEKIIREFCVTWRVATVVLTFTAHLVRRVTDAIIRSYSFHNFFNISGYEISYWRNIIDRRD